MSGSRWLYNLIGKLGGASSVSGTWDLGGATTIHRGSVPADVIRSQWNVDESIVADGAQIAQLPEAAVLCD